MVLPRDPCSILVRPEEAAILLGVGRSTVFELIACGDLASIKIGRCRRIEREEIAAFIARQRNADQRDTGQRVAS